MLLYDMYCMCPNQLIHLLGMIFPVKVFSFLLKHKTPRNDTSFGTLLMVHLSIAPIFKCIFSQLFHFSFSSRQFEYLSMSELCVWHLFSLPLPPPPPVLPCNSLSYLSGLSIFSSFLFNRICAAHHTCLQVQSKNGRVYVCE